MIIQDHSIAHHDVALRVGSDVLLVRHHHNCDSMLVELLKNSHDLAACAAIEIASRFVCKQDLGLVNQRPRDGHALLLAARKLTWMVVFSTCKTDRCKDAI